MKNPCWNCPNVGCGTYHDKCPEYQAYRHGKEKEYEERLKKGSLRVGLDDSFERRTRSLGWRSRLQQR